MSSSNDSLLETVEPNNDSGSMTLKNRIPLRLRLVRVFSSGSLKSPNSSGAPSRCNSVNGSPERSSPRERSCLTKSRYSWQPPSRSSDSSPRSPAAVSGTWRTTPGSSTLNSPKTPSTPTTPGRDTANWFVDVRMKYSPQQQQQQQKERKSESDVGSVEVTPSHAIRESTKSETSTTSGGSSSRVVESAGLFAWMRVFRLASILHQTGC